LISLLHTADWQIGRIFSQFDEDDAAALFEARFKVIERLAAIAHERRADAVLVAGDVFDTQTVSDKTIRRMFIAMQGFSGPWLLLPGNHDAALSESVWSRAQRLGVIPGNVVCCLTPTPHTVADKFTLLPAPLTQRKTYQDLTDWFAQAASPAELPRIGLAHGCVQGILADNIDSTNPIAAGRAAQAGLDYLALGDWHGTRQIDERTWYAGTPETDRFRDNDSGQALWVTLTEAGALPQVEVLRTGSYLWQQTPRTLAVPSDIDELVTELQAIGSHDVRELRTAGTCDLSGHRQLDAAVKAAQASARALIWDSSALRLEPTEADLRALHADGFVGEALQELRTQQHGDDAELAREALLILARVLDAHSSTSTATTTGARS